MARQTAATPGAQRQDALAGQHTVGWQSRQDPANGGKALPRTVTIRTGLGINLSAGFSFFASLAGLFREQLTELLDAAKQQPRHRILAAFHRLGDVGKAIAAQVVEFHRFLLTPIGMARMNGEGGIRTLGRLASTSVFETDPIGRSGTSPQRFGTGRKTLVRKAKRSALVSRPRPSACYSKPATGVNRLPTPFPRVLGQRSANLV
jgi:hypothetical protein